MSANITTLSQEPVAEPLVHPAHKALAASLAKLEALIERAVVRGHDQTRLAVDDRAIASEKGRMLLELSRLSLPKGGPQMPPSLIEKAARIRSQLLDEQRFLKRRMEAAEVISGLIADAVLAAEWDGIYEPRGAIAVSGPRRGAEDASLAGPQRPRLRAQPKTEAPE